MCTFGPLACCCGAQLIIWMVRQVVSAGLPVWGGLECTTGLRGSTLTKTQMFCTAAPAPERPSRDFCALSIFTCSPT